MLSEEIPSPPPYNGDMSGEAPPSYEEEDSKKPNPPREDVQAILNLIPGYEHLGANPAQSEHPPSYSEALTDAQLNPERQERSAPVISELEARQALLEHVTQQCCYGNAVVHGLEFSHMNSTTAYSYQLDTFTETRSYKMTFVSHYPEGDNVIDGPSQGIPPYIWDIPVDSPLSFTHDVQKEIPVPHTEILKTCFDCMGKAKKLCYMCLGDGKIGCGACGGHGGEYAQGFDGDRYFQTCLWCSGRGIRRCSRCDGKGYRRCNTCDGCGQLKFFILLIVKWQTHSDKHLCNDTPLPQKLAAKAKGHIVFKEEFSKLTPVQHSPSMEINSMSEKLIGHHKETFSHEKILKQRHFVRLIPVTHAHYKWKMKIHQFFVYGSNHKVHAPNYPQKCQCTIL